MKLLTPLRYCQLLLLLLLISGCAAAPAVPATTDGNGAASSEAAGAAPAGEKMTLQFAVNPWSASELNVAVATILLEEQLG